ncbi:probable 50S ribosomal protein L1 [Rhynchosporium agropyri]|uniref:Probable 50S ribosomal protein L1 n=3 Tax=Rhynchosporium TaxID=38037 RepID=A0A1E1MK67_RHYSE|nr:probable 50S ribosomal protein L1 [Rhynchosporium agropyri]CZS99488.1 probable 50S ribosomal protein L1 [Rhynchosporium commune]CZT49481.1 probable 50S ribosomal protein L1 [Rhynchosporium secalis]
MATARPSLAQLSRLCLVSSRPTSAKISARYLSTTTPLELRGPKANSKVVVVKGKATSNPQKNKKKGEEGKKKKKARTTYIQYDPRDADQFSLCDAMRYIRAFEVGQKPTSVKYEMHVKFKSLKNGPVIRNRLRLPHPVKTDVRICVICPPDSKYAKDALAAGATLVGEDEIFEAVKDGKIEFDRCICQLESLEKMNRAGLGRFLGPRGLMPSTKLGTVVKDPANMLKDLIGGAEYRERLGVVRMAIGQLGFTPEEMQRNIKAFIDAMKKDMANLNDKISKELAEVVLSSTNSPGFPLNGEFRSLESDITPRDLSTS